MRLQFVLKYSGKYPRGGDSSGSSYKEINLVPKSGLEPDLVAAATESSCIKPKIARFGRNFDISFV